MIYGYARISNPKQNIDRQIRNIQSAYPTAHIVSEAYTGTKIDRPEFDKLIGRLEKNDTVVFDSVSRMSRNADEGFKLYEKLFNQEVNLIFLKEPHINTDTYKKANTIDIKDTGTSVDIIINAIREYLMELAKEQIRIAFEQAQKEVDDLHQRTKEGLQTARLNGKQIGQKQGATLTIKAKEPIQKYIMQYSKDFNGTLKDSDVIAIINTKTYEVVTNNTKQIKPLKVSRNTYYKYKKELQERK